MKKILFVDMDGVLANFDKGLEGDFKRMFKPTFFRNLEPLENGLNETIEGIRSQGYLVKILSKACVKKSNRLYEIQKQDKINWLKEFIPCIAETDVIIQATDESKGDIVELHKESECFLIDDYSKNLAEWGLAGGKCIKKAKRIRNHREWKQVLNISELSLEGVE